MLRLVVVLCMLFNAAGVWAQTSPNYQLSEHVFNDGGNPDDGVVLQSPNFTISLDSLGQGITGGNLTSASFNSEAGFVYAYPPPLEVIELWFTSKTMLNWVPEQSVGTYNVYRGLIGNLSSGYGTCLEHDIGDEYYEDTSHYSGQAYFYIVTAANRLDEEGTMGNSSVGIERINTNPCN